MEVMRCLESDLFRGSIARFTILSLFFFFLILFSPFYLFIYVILIGEEGNVKKKIMGFEIDDEFDPPPKKKNSL